MGRYYWSKKEEADSLKKIQTWWLKKYGYLDPDCFKAGGIKWTHGFSSSESSVTIRVSTWEEKYLEIIYTQTDRDGNKQDFDYKISLATTLCYFGGKRYWFICPWYTNGKYCGRRVGVLYLGSKYFACRHCYNLTYNSRNLSGFSKVAGQVISIPELERLEKEVKRRYYAGKMTRKYKMFQKKVEKSIRQLMIAPRTLSSHL